MEEKPKTATSPITLERTNALDCTDANARTVLGYYRSGIIISLPVDKYLMFMHWIMNDLFHKARTIEEVVSSKHTAEKVGNTVYLRCDFNEKKKGDK